MGRYGPMTLPAHAVSFKAKHGMEEKTILCGHWHASYGHAKYPVECVQIKKDWSEDRMNQHEIVYTARNTNTYSMREKEHDSPHHRKCID